MTSGAGKSRSAARAAATGAAAQKRGANKRAAPKPKARSRKFGRETVAQKRARAAEIIERLHREYPDSRCSLTHRNAYELLTATILSAQCTDERVNQVTPALFERYPAAEDLAHARPAELESLIRPTGFYRNKAKSLLGMAGAVADRHGGRVPDTMEELVDLPGVGRKTANVVLGNAFDKAVGVVVDTHVTRLAGRLGLTRHRDPIRIEQDLMKRIPREEWTDLAHLFIDHGRAVCKAPTPRCERCVLNDICPSSRV
jgi:endonuclease-3